MRSTAVFASCCLGAFGLGLLTALLLFSGGGEERLAQGQPGGPPSGAAQGDPGESVASRRPAGARTPGGEPAPSGAAAPDDRTVPPAAPASEAEPRPEPGADAETPLPVTTITGTARDADLRPLRKARLTLLRHDPSYARYDRPTDLEGRFVFDNVGPGVYEWQLAGGDDGRILGAGALKVPAAASFAWDLVLPRTGVSGEVVDGASGAPVQAAWLTIFTGRYENLQHFKTLADGKFRFEGLPPGTYTLGVYVYDSEYAYFRKEIPVVEGMEIRDVTVALSPGAKVWIKATDRSGNPIRQISIHVYRGDELVNYHIGPRQCDGSTLMRDVGPGEYRFEVGAPGYRTVSRSPIRLIMGENPTQEFQLDEE